MRASSISRKTTETQVEVALELDGWEKPTCPPCPIEKLCQSTTARSLF